MTILTNTAEGGTNGAAVTVANSGGASGDALAVVTISGGGAVTYDSAAAHGGALGFKSTIAAASENAYVTLDITSSPQATIRAFFPGVSAYPSTGEVSLVSLRTTGAGTAVATLVLANTGQIRVRSASSAATTGTFVVPLNTPFYVDLNAVPGVDAATGTIRAKVYMNSSTTASDTIASSTTNAGTLPIRFARAGIIAGPAAYTLRYDDIMVDPDGSFPLVATTNPPTLALNGSTTKAVIDLTGSTSSPAGATLTTSISPMSASVKKVSELFYSIERPTTGPIVYTVVLTDLGTGRTASGTYTVAKAGASAATFERVFWNGTVLV